MEQELTLHEAKIGLLRVIDRIDNVDELQCIRQIITNYYAKKVDDEMDRLWESGVWNEQKIKDLENVHLRTPYRHAK